MALFYCASALAGAFSGLLAAGIAKMDGLGNYEGWRWIFIIEGLASVVLGVVCFYCLPDSPSLAIGKWLTPDEAHFLDLIRITTRGKPPSQNSEPGSKKKRRAEFSLLKTVLADWQLYLQAIIFSSNAVPNYGLKFTLPQIIKNMGFTSTTAQLLTAPPYFLGALSAIFSSYIADKFLWRMPVIVSAQSLLVVGFSILFVKAADIKNNIPLCYFSVFLATSGIYPIIPGCNAWTVNNTAGPAKRSLAIALMIAVGNTSGLVGSFIYLEKESPKYPTGFGTSLAFAAAGITAAVVLELTYTRINRKRDSIGGEEEVRKRYSEEELEVMGDRSPLFRYSL
jgi:predicted MFS family arabinose efflux permease